MRYRIETYDVSISGTSVFLYVPVPDMPWAKIEEWDSTDQDEKITQYITESLRLIVDETACVVLCSSMQKAKLESAYITQVGGYDQNITLEFTIPTGKTITTDDQFTIEFDFGEAPEDMKDPNSQLVADFFNITEATDYEAASDSEILNELDDLWTEITGQPVPSSGGSSSN